MWFFYAIGSALFAGITSVLAKCGIKKTNSDLATALRTVIVLLFSWLMVFLTGEQHTLRQAGVWSYVFLILSGLATGASWLCYFRALQLGRVSQVVAVDKFSVVLTILFAFILLGEQATGIKIAGVAGIGLGTYFMIQKRPETEQNKTAGAKWFPYAAGSAVFASLTSILGKIGISGVGANAGTAIRTVVVLIMAWLVVLVKRQKVSLGDIPKNEIGFLILSGVATGASWLCYFKALQSGPASAVVAIDKLSILVAVFFSYVFLKERLEKRNAVGLFLITVGTIAVSWG